MNAARRGWQFRLLTILLVVTYAAPFQFALAHLIRKNPEGAFWTLALGVPHTLLIAVIIVSAVRAGSRTSGETPRD